MILDDSVWRLGMTGIPRSCHRSPCLTVSLSLFLISVSLPHSLLLSFSLISFPPSLYFWFLPDSLVSSPVCSLSHSHSLSLSRPLCLSAPYFITSISTSTSETGSANTALHVCVSGVCVAWHCWHSHNQRCEVFRDELTIHYSFIFNDSQGRSSVHCREIICTLQRERQVGPGCVADHSCNVESVRL